MSLATILATVPCKEWTTRQAVIFDWYDGPRQGICALARPACEFVFDLLDERYNPDGLDDRLFRLSELPSGSVDELLAAIHDAGGPANPAWIPMWKFTTETARREADAKVQEILAQGRATDVVIWTQDMEQFLGFWIAADFPSDRRDWFATLNIPQETTS